MSSHGSFESQQNFDKNFQPRKKLDEMENVQSDLTFCYNTEWYNAYNHVSVQFLTDCHLTW